MKPRQIQEYVSDLSTISEELADKLQAVRDQNDKDKSVPNILNLFYAWSIESKSSFLLWRKVLLAKLRLQVAAE